MNPFIKEKVCFYSSMFRGRSSSWEIVKYAEKCGVAGVELMNFSDELATPDKKAALEIGNYAKSAGLVLPCFSCGTKIAGPDRKKNLESLKGYAEICSSLEIPYLHHTVYCNFLKTDMPKCVEDYFLQGVESSLEIYEYSKRLGVQTLVEDQGYIFNGVENYARFMKETDYKIGTVLDFGNIMFCNECAEDFCDAFGHNVRHVHVKDFKYADKIPEGRGGYETNDGRFIYNIEVGKGDVNFDAIAKSLEKINYQGYYAMEYADVEDECEVLRTLEYTAEKLAR